jgi:CspA family cold shock protein
VSERVQGGYTAPAGTKPNPPVSGSGVARPTVSAERFGGKVKWFNPDKGYGFVTPDGQRPGERDIFLHVNVLPDGIDTVKEGQHITYQTEAAKKGLRAVKVLVTS